MINSDNKLWPYKPKLSIVVAMTLAFILLIAAGILHSNIGWPPDASTYTVLLGVLMLGLLPVLLDVCVLIGGTFDQCKLINNL